MKTNILNIRYVARVTLEADTPLRIGSGESGLNTDQLVMTDFNGLPFIPGTSITGVLRNSLKNCDDIDIDELFGYQAKDKGLGSRLIVSSGYMVGDLGAVIQQIAAPGELDASPFYRALKDLPTRKHVRINHLGASDNENNGKFDEQVVFKGSRFVFELELIGNESDRHSWNQIIEQIHHPLFRLGGGTRKGFGKLKIIQTEISTYDLTDLNQLNDYLNKSASLNEPFGKVTKERSSIKTSNLLHYQLHLRPDDFFIFSSGSQTELVDINPVTERIIQWNEQGTPFLSEENILIPASSIKGALSHRTAFHYNVAQKIYADQTDNPEMVTTTNNMAVKALFGFQTDDKNSEKGQRGRILISDLFLNKVHNKIFNHVSIDRFTGGAIPGFLFNEGPVTADSPLVLDLYVEPQVSDTEIMKAFEKSLLDITTGMLPLGGGVMRGHGCFNGIILKNEEELNHE